MKKKDYSTYRFVKMEEGFEEKNSEYISLARATEGTPYSQEYLSLLVRKGKLHAKKFGRNWRTTKSAVADYILRQQGQLLKRFPDGNGIYGDRVPDSASAELKEKIRYDIVSDAVSYKIKKEESGIYEEKIDIPDMPGKQPRRIRGPLAKSMGRFAAHIAGDGLRVGLVLAVSFAAGVIGSHVVMKAGSASGGHSAIVQPSGEGIFSAALSGDSKFQKIKALGLRQFGILTDAFQDGWMESRHDFAAIADENQNALAPVRYGLTLFAQKIFAAPGRALADTAGSALCRIFLSCSRAGDVALLDREIASLRSLRITRAWTGGGVPLSAVPPPAAAAPRETTRTEVREVIERRETFVPADFAVVKKDILASVDEMNKAIREHFENAIANLSSSLSRTSSRTESAVQMVTVTNKIDRLVGVSAEDGVAIKSGGLDITSGNIVIASGGITADNATLRGALNVSAGTSTLTHLSVAGNSTIGDASGDWVTVNAGTVNFINSATTTIPSSAVNAFSYATSTAAIPFLSFDTLNYRIGVGTTSPGATFSIAGSILASGSLTLQSSQTVIADLTVNGNTTLGDAIGDSLTLNAGAISYANTSTSTIANDKTNAWSIATSSALTPIFTISTASTTPLGAGAVGIGTTSPLAALFNVAGDGYFTGGLGLGRATTTDGNFEITGSALFGDAQADIVGFNSGLLTFSNSATTTIPLSAINSFSIATSSSAVPLFSFDTSNYRVGLGTTSPAFTFSAAGSGYFTQNLIADGTTGFTLNGAGADIIFAGSGNHDLVANGGTLRIATSTLFGDIVADGSYVDIGTAGTRLGIIYADEVNATTLVGTLSAGNLTAATFTINSDNATADTEDSNIAYERGSLTPNALITWDSTSDEFDFNSGFNLTGTIAGTNGITFTTFTTDITTGTNEHLVLAPNGTGLVGIGTTTPAALLSVQGNALISGTSTMGNLVATSTLMIGGTTGSSLIVLQSGNIGIGTTSPGTTLGVNGDAVLAGALTVRSFNATSTSATSTIQGFLDVLGTGTNATSTYSSNLWVKGTLQTGTGSVFLGNNFLNFNIPATTTLITNRENAFTIATSSVASSDFTLFTVNTSSTTNSGAGTIGIGTSSPYARLSVEASTTASAFAVRQVNSSTQGSLASFFDGITEALTISGSGRLGVASSSPGAGVGFATSTYIVGGLGVGVATTTSDNFQLQGAAQIGGALSVSGASSFTSTLLNSGLATLSGGILANSATSTITNLVSVLSTSTQATSTNLYTSGQSILAATAGNVGIGTTNPIQALHVVGQCVTGDTELRRKKKRRRKNEKGEWIEEEYFEKVRIDQVQAGDEILTLDEKTGLFVASRVNALMDMGVKEIFELTTTTGKRIRTTANHPYFVKASSPELPKKKPRLGIFYDNANMFYAQKQAGWKVDFTKLRKELSEAFDVQFVNFYGAVPAVGDPAREASLRYFEAIRRMVNLKTKSLKYIKVEEEIGGAPVPGTKKKGDMDVEITLDVARRLEELDAVMVVSGDSDFLPLRDFVVKEHNKKIIFAGFESNMAWELRQMKHWYLNRAKTALAQGVVGKKEAPSQGPGVVLCRSLYSQPPSVSSGGVWKKVAAIREGMQIAVRGNDDRAKWERISRIRPLPAEQVYDIEVDATHNFIGNDIVAHNTYISTDLSLSGGDFEFGTGIATSSLDTFGGRLGVGTTSPGAIFSVSGGTTTPIVLINQTSTGDILSLDDNGTNVFVVKDGGNVGIGTTSPNDLLAVQTSGNFGGI
ncbi:MAG: NYN domain-containing protein, partial [Patescibacteria group bacterium]